MSLGRRAALVALLAAVLTGTSLTAHRRDEYLQAARLAIEPRRVEVSVDLTPGIGVAGAIIGDIDRNRDGSLSAGEKQAYVAGVLSTFELLVDGRTLRVEPISASFPDLEAVRNGVGTIRLRTSAPVPRLPDGHHEIVFHNRHRPDVSVYLANALVPDGDRIAITAQRRDPAQRDLRIAYVVREQSGVPASAWFMGLAGAMLLVVLGARR